MEYLGNKALLNAHKTAFLCSRQVGSRAVLRCYDWVTDICKEEGVVVSGFQSKIERDVLHFLLRGNKPIIIVLARKMYSSLPTEWQEAMEANRLLIISSTAPNAVRVSKAAADARNRYIAEYSDEIVFGSIQPNSSLNQVYKDYIEKANILLEKLE
ncbi:DNA-processing protein DprA [Hoylesella nanceiensis]